VSVCAYKIDDRENWAAGKEEGDWPVKLHLLQSRECPVTHSQQQQQQQPQLEAWRSAAEAGFCLSLTQ